jgi:hypothetical protein
LPSATLDERFGEQIIIGDNRSWVRLAAAFPGNLLNALGNLVPSHLLDPSLSSSRAQPRDEEDA